MSSIRIKVTERRTRGRKEPLTVVTAHVRHRGAWRPVQEQVLAEYDKQAIKEASDRLTASAQQGKVAVMYRSKASSLPTPGYWTFWCSSQSEADDLAARLDSSDISVVPT